MAAAEVPPEVGVCEHEMGPFEELCLSGLSFDFEDRLTEEAAELVKKMVLDKECAFLPMDHLDRAIDVLEIASSCIHRHSLPQARLFTGPKGVGKTHLFETVAEVLKKENKRAADGRLTICCHIDLQKRRNTKLDSFDEVFFKAIAYELGLLHRHPDVAEVLTNLAAHAAGSPDDIVELEHLPGIFTLRGNPEALSPALREKLAEAGARGRLAIASALLRQAGIGVIVFVDEAECLFQQSKFDSAVADRWREQLYGILSLKKSAIGMVVCASFQRARQLFLSDGSAHDFPPDYAHLSLRADWNGSKFKQVRLGGVKWTRSSLMNFLLTHTCRVVDPSFTLYREEEETQTPGAAVGAAQEASSAVAKEDKQPSEAALEMARKLDALFMQRWKGEDELSEEEKLDMSLEQVLEMYGHTPRDLARAATEHLCSWMPPRPWPIPSESRRLSGSKLPSAAFNLVMTSFLELLPEAVRAGLPKATMLGFRSAEYTVQEEQLERHLMKLPQETLAAAAGVSTAQGAATTTPTATRLVDNAVDKGWLVEHEDCLGLGSLGVYRRFGRGGVHADVMVWIRYNGYGQEAELPITRALARMPDQGGHVLVTVDSVVEKARVGAANATERDVKANKQAAKARKQSAKARKQAAKANKQAVKASNSDTEGGQLAGVRMTVVTNSTADLPAQAAAPAESVGAPHAAAGAGGAGGGGQAAGAEADWRARARAAYEALKQVHESLWEYLALRKGAFWMKELPDVYGGDVIRVSYEVRGRVTTVWIMRVQVKRANQKTLEKGDKNKAGAAAVRTAVEGLMGVGSYSEAKREHIEGKHILVVRAVGDLIAAAKAMYNKPKLRPDQMPAWDRLFKAYVGGEKFHVEDGGAMIALTHTVPDGMREHVEGQLGIRVVDGTNLRGHWGPLGLASKGEGLYLETAGAKPDEAAGSSRPLTEQDELDAMFEEFMG